MLFFIHGYAAVPLIDSVALNKSLPVPAVGDSKPSAVSSGDAVSGQLYWKKVDTTDGSTFVWASNKRLIVSNVHATDACLVTVVFPDDTLLGQARTNPDLTLIVAAGKLAIFPEFLKTMAAATRITVTVAESGGSAGRANTYVAVLPI